MNNLIRHPKRSEPVNLEAEREPTLRERLRSHFRPNSSSKTERCLLLDISGSMAYPAGTGRTKFEELKRAIAEFRSERVFVFSNDCEERGGVDDLPEYPAGGTMMDIAFETVKGKGIVHAIIVTDGCPDSESRALQAASGLCLDILYIGPPPVPGFLGDLARVTGGQFGTASFAVQGQLTTKIRGLLE